MTGPEDNPVDDIDPIKEAFEHGVAQERARWLAKVELIRTGKDQTKHMWTEYLDEWEHAAEDGLSRALRILEK